MKKFARFATLPAIMLFATIFFNACATQDTRSISISPAKWLDDAMREVCWSVESSAQCEEILHSTCEAGDYRNCALLGYTYTNRLNFPTDDYRATEEKAVALFKKACDGKYGSGCFALGMLQGSDDLVAKGCEYGDFFACSHIIDLGVNADNAQVAPTLTPQNISWASNRKIELLKDECDRAKIRLKNESDKDRITTREALLAECQAELQKAQSENNAIK